MSSIIVNGRMIVGHYSKVSGSRVREMFDSTGRFLGYIERLEEGGYRCVRIDGKQRHKKTLEEAYRSIGRRN